MESKSLSKKGNKATELANKKPARKKASQPEYLKKKIQKKMAVSDPADSQEKEADKVAADVKQNLQRGNDEPAVAARSVSSSTPSISRTEEDDVQAKLFRAEEEEAQTKVHREEEEVQTKVFREEEEEAAQTKLFRNIDELAQAKLYRQEEEEVAQTRLHRTEEDPVQTKLMRKERDEQKAHDEKMDEVEARIAQSRGNGSPLPDEVRQKMEQQFGKDFSRVVIHTDMQSDELCKELNARAFAIGNDIYFATGEFNPDSERGQELLAHELTHVVQTGSSIARTIFRKIAPEDTPAGNTAASSALTEMLNLRVPAIKQRHLSLYSQLASEGKLGRVAGYDRPHKGGDTTKQKRFWEKDIVFDEAEVGRKLGALTPAVSWPTNNRHQVRFQIKNDSKTYAYTRKSFLKKILKVPKWDREGNPVPQYQVDHIVELQTSGAHGTRYAVGNSLQNMELLDQPSNSSSGSTIMSGIHERVDNYIKTLDESTRPTKKDWLKDHSIYFDQVTVDSSMGKSEGNSSWWTLDEIKALSPLDALKGAPPITYEGDDRSFALFSGKGGIEVGRFGHAREATEFSPRGRSSRSLAGMVISSITLNDKAEQDNLQSEGVHIGKLNGRWDLPEKWAPENTDVELMLFGLGPYAGYVVPPANLPADFEPTSPAIFSDIEIGSEGFMAEGEIPKPTIPLLENLSIGASWIGSDVMLRAEYSPQDLKIPMPGLTINGGSIGLFYSGQEGFGVDGTIFVEVSKLGEGSLTAGDSQRSGFFAEGTFDFDSKLFDEASATLRYRDKTFSGDGTLKINSPDKIKGIKAAELQVSFSEEAFSAEGTVDPDIPGVQQAGLTVDYSEEEGLTIGGSLELTANPAIRSGSINVKVNKNGEEWKVSGEGTAQPDIPGIDSELTVGYEDGGFVAEFSGGFERGMLSGDVTVGVSNRAVGEDGKPSGDPLPGGELLVYGSGSATIQIAPWLQGTAGVQFDPNGEVTVSGEIGIPDELEIFARKEINKTIFQVAVQVPIIPGSVAEVGGGLSAVAGIGPGVIDELKIGIEYNPAREQDTKVTGDAHLKVPADAGLRLSVRAGIGLGITGASATGGLDIGGTLGISGAATAGVHIDWTPATGLDLTADLEVYAQPSFTFDIGGYVSVKVFGWSVYDDRFEFASYTFGSDYRFGIKLPVHYKEGEPFDISTDDIEFEIPDISTNDLLKGLISRIT